MTLDIGVAHYPEGVGHATRMMAIAHGLRAHGARVSLAGGGASAVLYEMNDFEVFEPTKVDYIRDFQHVDGILRGLGRVLTHSIPDSARRLREVRQWLTESEFDAVVTDDMFVAAAAVRTHTPPYVLTHNAASFYRNLIVRASFIGINRGLRVAARRFFFPAVWPPRPDDPPQVSRVPPIALETPGDVSDPGPDDPGIVLVPSTYSTGFDDLAATLRDEGYTVTNVGASDWDPVPALLPVLERAGAVVCAGYSTVMEAAVAGTPCIVVPATNEQRGFARRLGPVDGFAVAENEREVIAAVNDLPAAPAFNNGVAAVTERIMDDLE